MISGTEGLSCQAVWAFPFGRFEKWPFAFAGLSGVHGTVLALFTLAPRAFLPVGIRIGLFHEVLCLGRKGMLKH